MTAPSSQKSRGKGSRPRWFPLVWAVPVAVIVVVGAILLARWLRYETGVGDFIASYPGEVHLPDWAPVGFPAWLAWSHFFNAFIIVLLVRSGLLIRFAQRPGAFWTRRNKGLVKTSRPPVKHSINHWLHFSLDWLWILNGAIFIVLLFVTGQWIRIVPTSWDFIPHSISVLVQYVSLDWPIENGWINYNALQVIAYFVTVFIAAPLAIITGFRMSPLWRNSWTRLSKVYPVQVARVLHYPIMLYFVAFIIVHVTLVLTTGALRNLNHMYAVRDDTSWVGFWFFIAATVVMVAGWVLVRPMILRPIASLSGNVTRN